MEYELNLDSIISTIQKGDIIPEPQVVALLYKIIEVFTFEDNVLQLYSPITICGDIHGQIYDLFELFNVALSDGVNNITIQDKFLFMGDYVDRGGFSINTFCYLCALKLKFPNNFFMLRGNHEFRQINQIYGFYSESIINYGHPGIWSLFNDAFDVLPIAGLIDGKVFAVHGGLSPRINLIESISLMDKENQDATKGPLADLYWSDPDETDKWRQNTRGAGWIFGSKHAKEFCHNNGLDFITRSHQLVMEGYKWYFDNKVVTIWSAPNYMYRGGNKACIMQYHPNELETYSIV